MTATATRSDTRGPVTARPERAATPRNDVRRTVLAALACALGTFPLCQLFLDRGWLIDVWLTMAIVIAPAAVLRRKHAANAGQIWIGVVLMIPWLTLNFLRQHAVLGLVPLSGSMHDLSTLLSGLHTTTRDETAPVHTTVAIRLAVCVLMGLVVALVDLLAVVGRRGALAGVPLLVVFTVSGAVPRKPVSWQWFVLAAAGFLILLALDSSDDLQRWGHLVPRSKKTGRHAAGLFTAQRIAAGAILLAVLVPLAVPSNSRNFFANLFHPDSGGGNGFPGSEGTGRNGIDPFASLAGQLDRPEQTSLLNVTLAGGSGDPSRVDAFYLRTNVLSDFTGGGWRVGPAGQTENLQNTRFESSLGPAVEPRTRHFRADIAVTGLRSNPPVFGSPTQLSGLDPSTEWEPQDLLLDGSRLVGGQVVREQVAQPDPTARQLRAATGQDPQLQPWLQLPAVPSQVRTLTAGIVAGRYTPYDRARAISNFFADPRNNFQYSLATTPGDSGNELVDFLTNRIGYCQQYAAAMGVMLRLADVPARVVLGYTHPAPNSAGTFAVTNWDAHAWVEAYFVGIGWIPFDPTPQSSLPGGSTTSLRWAPNATNSAPGPITAAPTPTNGPNHNVLSGGAKRSRPSASAPAPVTSTGHGGDGVALLVPGLVLLVVLLLVLGLGAPPFARRRRRRRRLHRTRQGDVEAVWAELADSITDMGYRWSAARTPRQVATWLAATTTADPAALEGLCTAVERARYAQHSAVVDGEALIRHLVAVEQTLLSALGPRAVRRARFWPASLRWSSVPVVGRWLPGPAGGDQPRRGLARHAGYAG